MTMILTRFRKFKKFREFGKLRGFEKFRDFVKLREFQKYSIFVQFNKFGNIENLENVMLRVSPVTTRDSTVESSAEG